MAKDRSDTARAFWVTGRRRGEVRAEPLARRRNGEVSVRAVFSAISRGTEATVWRGGVPESEYDRMRAPFQAGDFPWPVKYGYMNVGRIEAGPASRNGTLVHCLYPHQTRFQIAAGAAVPLPPGLPPGRAVLGANMETAVNALWDGVPRVGDRIAVVGAGTVGCLVAWLAGRMPGVSVQLIDSNPDRVLIASRLGVGFAVPAAAEGGCDLVFHASGNSGGLETALALAGREARIVELSWYGDRTVNLPLGGAFHSHRLQILSSQVGSLPADRNARWSHRTRMALALSLLRDDALDCLITGEDRFDDLPAVFDRIDDAPDMLCHRIRYED